MTLLLQLKELELDEKDPGFETFQRETDSLQAQAGSCVSQIRHDLISVSLSKLLSISGNYNI